MKRKRIGKAFFLRRDVTLIARELLGKILLTQFNGMITSGRIVETEAYEGEVDRASHAFRGKTPRTAIMFGEGGKAYVYLCYGIHQMFNIVTNQEGTAHAILIRAVEPLSGIEHMLKRTGKRSADHTLTRGPGNVGKALGFHTSQCGLPVFEGDIQLLDDGFALSDSQVGASPRVGVDYAGEHAEWHYRFYIKGNPYVSGKIRK